MKLIRFVAILSVTAVVLTLASCNPTDENPAPRRTPPTASFGKSSGFFSRDTTVTSGTIFRVAYSAKPGSSGMTKYLFTAQTLAGAVGQTVNYRRGQEDSDGRLNTTITDTFSVRFNGLGRVQVKTFARDLNGLEDSARFTITFQ